jgi:radical SAM-linked protein
LSVLRVRYAKLGRSRWIGHLDLARCFERAVRRARIAARYSEGFSSHLRLAFGPALPVGAESVAEYLDVELAAESPPAPEVGAEDRWAEALSEALPDGLDVCRVVVLERRPASLQASITSVEWRIDAAGMDAGALADAAGRVLSETSIMVSRRRKGVPALVDVRPSLRRLEVRRDDDALWLGVEATLAPVALRPAELADAMGLDGARVRCCRLAQWIEQGGQRWAPEELDASTPSPGVQVGAT